MTMTMTKQPMLACFACHENCSYSQCSCSHYSGSATRTHPRVPDRRPSVHQVPYHYSGLSAVKGKEKAGVDPRVSVSARGARAACSPCPCISIGHQPPAAPGPAHRQQQRRHRFTHRLAAAAAEPARPPQRPLLPVSAVPATHSAEALPRPPHQLLVLLL